MRTSDRSQDIEIARIAGGQHGVITHAQLLAAGVSLSGVNRRVAKGRLHREHRGVYRVGHRAPSTDAQYLAAVLACGANAFLSTNAAAHQYGLVKGTPPPPEVTSLDAKNLPGVTTHRVRHLDPRDTTVYRQIPTTTVPRTLVDLAATLSLDALARACHEAEVRHGVKPRAIEAALARRPKTPGAANLRAIIHGDHHLLLSQMERQFLTLLRAHHFPPPQTNRRRGRRYVDCRWPHHRLTVELDSYTFHHSRHAWEDDRQREREARGRGDEFRRYTWRDVAEDQSHLLRDLGGLLPRL